MKKIIGLLAVAVLGAVLVGCGDKGKKEEPPVVVEKVYGWHMTAWEAEGEDKDLPKEVYIAFAADGTFRLYQDVVSNGFVKYTGTYTFGGATLSGVYSDGEAWDHSYTVAGADNLLVDETTAGLTMTMTATNEAGYILTYASGLIPESVTESALLPTRGAEGGIPIL